MTYLILKTGQDRKWAENKLTLYCTYINLEQFYSPSPLVVRNQHSTFVLYTDPMHTYDTLYHDLLIDKLIPLPEIQRVGSVPGGDPDVAS